tara:strand:+ start:409 stop:1245 length:837 start_codon:yes stop_codon:yes gene_type:complete
MTIKSCVQHLEKKKLVIVREEYVDLCEGDCCSAALLNYFEYWHNIKLDHQKLKLETKPDFTPSQNDLLQWHKIEKLNEAMLGLFGDRKIRASLAFLEKNGYVTVHRNPDPRYKFDNTKFFLFQPEVINAALQESYTITPKDQGDACNMEAPSCQNQQDEAAKLQGQSLQKVIDHPAKLQGRGCRTAKTVIANMPQQYTEITNKDYIHKLHTNNNKFYKNNFKKNETVEQQRERFLDEEYLRLREQCGNENMPTSRCDEDYFAKFDRELREFQNRKGKR